MKSTFSLTLLLALQSILGNATLPGRPLCVQNDPTFAEVIIALRALSEAGEGFSSIETSEKITVGGHKDVNQVSMSLPGAKACFLSCYDKSYVAWMGSYPTLTLAKTNMAALTKKVQTALGLEYQYEDDYLEARKGTYMRFFHFDSKQNRTSSVLAIELAYFDNQYQIRLSIPSKSPEYYIKSTFYEVTPTPAFEVFKKAFEALQAGIPNHFANVRDKVAGEDLITGKIYSLKIGLPGMTCVAAENPGGLFPEYCRCLSNTKSTEPLDFFTPYAELEEKLLYIVQPLGYVITDGSTPEGLQMLLMAKPRPSEMSSKNIIALYIKSEDGVYQLGVSMLDGEF